jgi:Uma2 family endonuclease
MTVATSKASSSPPVGSAASNGEVPPLESGDRLSRAEFMRRYEAMPDLKKAELIDGVVYVASPVRQKYHGKQNHHLGTWLGYYESVTPGVEGGDNSTVFLESESTPQPDSLLFITPECGGHVRINELGYIEGAPDLVAEIAASSASYDLHDKLRIYRRDGVREYIVCRVFDRQVDWFFRHDDQFERIPPDGAGIHRSKVFPGLWLDPAALLRGDLRALLAALSAGLASPEHGVFAARLQKPGGQPAS